ncbi:caspase family protein [Flavobacteriaceae bacterium KMM 6898]|nr:caspase family protein [Flavobacteriaceae bacterium KMM 6898]
MAKGISLHIGLNYVDPNHYSGWDGKLNACEYDANDMFLISKSQGFQSAKLIRNEATRNRVISAIKNAASNLIANDFFVISYSGHGGQIPDINGDEDDGMDETWCLFDGELVDDEISQLWSLFSKGVRVLVFSDSCHSGTAVKVAKRSILWENELSPKFMPSEIAASTYFSNKDFYENILKNVKEVKSQNIEASIKLISGCQDNQYSYDGPFNGQFTSALKRIWNGGKFSGDYFSFHKQIMNLLPDYQTPNHFNIGQLNHSFDNQKPFSI